MNAPKPKYPTSWTENSDEIARLRAQIVALRTTLRYLASKVEDGDDALGTQQARVMAQDLLREDGE